LRTWAAANSAPACQRRVARQYPFSTTTISARLQKRSGTVAAQGKDPPLVQLHGAHCRGAEGLEEGEGGGARSCEAFERVWGKVGLGYPKRYGDLWEEELEKHLRKRLAPVTDLMDHVIDESAKAYEGTIHEHDFFIFHDGLSAWWEAGAQTHLRARGFEHRQIRNITANTGTRYEGKIVGDSPEMCRALDFHGFADLKAAILSYVSFTSYYDNDDPQKFNLGTPDAVFSSIERAFSVAPTSKRIVEDIIALPMVLDKIIEYKGCVVPDEALRHGRRLENNWESAKPGKGPLKNKPRSFQRIETPTSSVPPHPDVERARAMLKSRQVAPSN